METIEYTKGDATRPVGTGNKIIVHVCNDIGGWGKGFVMAISKKWKSPETEYRKWHQSKDKFELGEVQFVQVENDIWVGNMIGQRNIKPNLKGIPPIRYEAVKECLSKVGEFALTNNASVHMPRIGCGLAGGKWEDIEPLIREELSSRGIKTTVYDFE
ncbi:MAG: macro domain-containing protein [Sporocytophaga sp.]|nr:macro domain-containing protein [Sporocytophaga sp.]